MKAKTAIKKIIKQTGWTQLKLADAIGVKGQSVIAQRLAQENLSIKNALELLTPMGYEIVFRPVSGNEQGNDEYIIDGTDIKEN